METKSFKTEMISDPKSKYDFFVKVVVVGDVQVGKTSILKKALKNEFTEEYKSTKGYEFNIALIKVNDTIIKFQIWEISGEENSGPSLLNFRNANLGYLVYSVTSRESFNNLKYWIEKLRKKAPTIRIILIGNKCDDKDNRKVSYEEGKEISEKFNLENFEEVSAVQEFPSPNFLEKGAINLLKDDESGSNDASCFVSKTIMIDPDELNINRKQKCCL